MTVKYTIILQPMLTTEETHRKQLYNCRIWWRL